MLTKTPRAPLAELFGLAPELAIGGKPPVALVTGGSRGIGQAIVRLLESAGAQVAYTYWGDAPPADESCLAIETEASSHEGAKRVAARVSEALGPISILVNNAGVTRDGVVWKLDEAAWDEVLDVNLKGGFNYIQAVAGSLRQQKAGRIVNISSINALRGKFGQSNYAASKAGIIGLTKSVARELGPAGVTVNAVAPGLIETEMAAALPLEIKDRARQEALLGRLGRPEDVAGVVLFLCSRAAGHITGEVIRVDGGQYL